MTCPLVSVCVLAYNHEKYIEQALDSVFSQSIIEQCEVIIGEDNSSDNTVALVRKYEDRPGVRLFITPPDTKKIVIRGKPTGRRNLLNCLSRARGKYVIVLDGDDYWIDNEKLAKQVTLLESKPECSMCYHDSYREHDDGSRSDYENFRQGAIKTDSDIINRTVIPATATVMLRNYYSDTWPRIIEEARIADWPLFIQALGYGPSCYIEEKMSVYRIHGRGIWSGREVARVDTKFDFVNVLRNAKELLGPRYAIYKKDINKAVVKFKKGALKHAILGLSPRLLLKSIFL